MIREEAYSRCPADSYVEYCGSHWLIVPFEPVEQPRFFECRPVSQPAFAQVMQPACAKAKRGRWS